MPDKLIPTPSQTVGPFFARELIWSDGGKVLFASRGDRITLTGRVFDGNGAPVVDAHDGELVVTDSETRRQLMAAATPDLLGAVHPALPS